jgi:hypothetical protein
MDDDKDFMICPDCEHLIHWGDIGCNGCIVENGPCATGNVLPKYCEVCLHNYHDQAYGCMVCKSLKNSFCIGDPYQQYGTWEHESWLLELERQEG